jgi:hypothetical protein
VTSNNVVCVNTGSPASSSSSSSSSLGPVSNFVPDVPQPWAYCTKKSDVCGSVHLGNIHV